VTKIVRSGQTGSFDNLNSSQGTVRDQVAAITDAIRQLSGNPEIGPGNTINDPLSAPYVLYVNPYIGSDKFVSGSYSTSGSATERIDLQRLECGYSPVRPFKTINRAIIEVGIITAKSYYENPLANTDLVSIILSPGVSNALNGTGATSVSEWADGKDPTDAELQAFNPSATGGILLPRGATLCNIDLRKTIVRPMTVPAAADELSDASNRRAICKVTGAGYYFGLTFMDKAGSTSSHHLLDCFQFASKAELDDFYAKIVQAFGGPNNTGNLDNALAVTRTAEYEIVGPRPASGAQTISTDTTLSASPYIFNCSIRSNWGLCGIFADGSKPSGFKSMVTAQFTGVSLQRDLSCWQKYAQNQPQQWGSYFTDYEDFINSDPDDVRMNPVRRSFHIRCINDAIIQEVSVFAIGQGIHHWVQSGGEITITNSNSNFGGCAALAEGYKNVAFVSDSNWNVGSIRVATNLTQKTNNIRKIYLGVIDDSVANDATAIKLSVPISESISFPGVPASLAKDGYSLKPSSYVWVENSRGLDYRARFTSAAWNPAQPDVINVTAVFDTEDGINPGDEILNSQGLATGQNWPGLAGARIYIRRLQDVRTTDERKYSLRVNNTNVLSRTPIRDYILQTSPGSNGIVGSIPDSAMVTVAVSNSVAPEGNGVIRSASVELRRSNPTRNWSSGQLYRTGDCVSYLGKKWSCTTENSDTSFISSKWEQAYVHMENTYNPEDFWKNSQPTIIFDNDTDANDNTTTCGYNLSNVWSSDPAIQAQYRSASDYLGLHSLLVSLGFSSSNAHTILLPKTSSTRERNPNSQLDGLAPPSGAATSWNNWPIEFRRPSNIRLFGHAWEWAGTLNYTKALPEYQLELSAVNKFTYYFTNKNGGRVYASGFNEEGLIVSPQGLQDLATGNEISFEAIGDSNVPIDEIAFPTFFDQLAVNKLTINSELDLGSGVISGSPNWEGGFGEVLPELPVANTTTRGIIEIATGLEAREFLRDDLVITPKTLIEALGDAVKSVVNLRVSLSSSSAVPSSNQLNSTSIYVHPFNGNEIALYSTASLRWQVVRFSGVQTFSMSGASLANTNYDIYLYNSGTALSPTLAVEFVAWSNSTSPPTRGSQDGVLVRNGNPARRLIGVVRTTTAGTSTVDLGGGILGANSESFPKIYLANLYNLYDSRAVYFFSNSWTTATETWSVVPSSVYPTAPRISWVQAGDTLVTAFLDIYNNWNGEQTGQGPISYVAPGVDSSTSPAADAFYGEVRYADSTAGSQWARALSGGKHDIYYLYKSFAGNALLNEHPAHGMIVIVKT
jgi:hypothetical protein